MVRRLVFAKWVTVAGLLFLSGCDELAKGLESEGDKKTKAALAGIWFTVTEEPDEIPGKTVTVHSWLALERDGKFTEKLRGLYPDGRILEAGSDGEWLVTEDLFKLRYTAVNGNNLRRHDLSTMYALKIVSRPSSEFSYMNPLEPKSRPLTLKRVSQIGKEP